MLDSTRCSREFDWLTALAAKMFDCPICLVSLVDLNRQWFKSAVGLAAPETHRNLAFCSYTVLEDSPDVFVVLNSLEDPRFCNNLLVTGPPFVIFYAGAPIILDGQKMGSFCIIDNKPRKSFSLKQKRILRDIASIASSAIQWNRVASVAVRRRTQIMLSLTHNINTLSAALHLQIVALMADCTASSLDQHDAVCTLANQMNNISNDIMANVSSILRAAQMMPSLTVSFEHIADVSPFGPECALGATLASLTSLLSLTFPGLVCSIDNEPFLSSTHNCFVDAFAVVAYNAVSSALECGSLDYGHITIHFEELPWSAEENSCVFADRAELQQVGEIIFKFSASSKIIRLVDDLSLLKALDTITGSQYIHKSSEGIIYILKVPCLLTHFSGISRNVSQSKATVTMDPVSRVLIVDDDSTSTAKLRLYLENECGCDVHVAETGHEGEIKYLDSVQEGIPFDIMFVDLLIPAVDGFDMMGRINASIGKIDPDVMVIAMIGVAEQFEQFMHDCDHNPSELGFSYVISKPFNFEIIKKIILSDVEPKDSGRGGKKMFSMRRNRSFLEQLTNSDFVKWSLFRENIGPESQNGSPVK